MKISEAIQLLQAQMQLRGDVPLFVYGEDDEYTASEVIFKEEEIIGFHDEHYEGYRLPDRVIVR